MTPISGTISQNSKVTIGLLIATLSIVIIVATGWFTTAIRAANAMPRDEVYRTFVSREDYNRECSLQEKRLERIEIKLDKLLIINSSK